MATEARTVNAPRSNEPATRRLAGVFVLLVMGVACLVFWVGIPIGGLWALSKVTDSFAGHFVLAILAVPMAMAAFSTALFWLNNLYLRVTGVWARLEEDELEAGWQRRLRGPLEPMLFVSLAVALVALTIWFFFIAENPSAQVI
jgi:hypothetical protein